MKIAIYTAVFGDKDVLKPTIDIIKGNNIDYFLITDNEKAISNDYEIVHRKAIYDDVTKNARFYKVIGLDIFKNYDFVIWHDANLQIRGNKILDVINYVHDKPVGFFKHAERKCVYDEAIKCIMLDKDYPIVIFRQILGYFRAGIKNKMGLYDTSIVVKNSKLINDEFLQLWWCEILKKSRRDQLSLPYCLNFFKINPGVLQGSRTLNEYSVFHKHKHTNYNFLSREKPKKGNKFLKTVSITLIKIIKTINLR